LLQIDALRAVTMHVAECAALFRPASLRCDLASPALEMHQRVLPHVMAGHQRADRWEGHAAHSVRRNIVVDQAGPGRIFDSARWCDGTIDTNTARVTPPEE
jgi:hypothetical protein